MFSRSNQAFAQMNALVSVLIEPSLWRARIQINCLAFERENEVEAAEVLVYICHPGSASEGICFGGGGY